MRQRDWDRSFAWRTLRDAALNRQTLEEAIAAYTKDAAYAEFQEDKKGQIK